jgi:hypothetical protein
MKVSLRKFKEKDDNKSRIKYWEGRKAYEKSIAENRRYI